MANFDAYSDVKTWLLSLADMEASGDDFDTEVGNSRGGLMGAAAERVLGPIAVTTENLEEIFRETMTLEQVVQRRGCRTDQAPMLSAIIGNMINRQENLLGYSTTRTLVSVCEEDLLSQSNMPKVLRSSRLGPPGSVIRLRTSFTPRAVPFTYPIKVGQPQGSAAFVAAPTARCHGDLQDSPARTPFVAAASFSHPRRLECQTIGCARSKISFRLKLLASSTPNCTRLAKRLSRTHPTSILAQPTQHTRRNLANAI